MLSNKPNDYSFEIAAAIILSLAVIGLIFIMIAIALLFNTPFVVIMK